MFRQDDPRKKPETKNLVTLSLSSTYEIEKMKYLTSVQDDVTQFLPADFKSSTRATTSFESESLLRELLTSLKVRKYTESTTKFFTRIC
jgi:hypothetical protein